jgi:predicted regulator of Ras-like GTPase activity (Roadblock/LC7/MglB family)
LTEGKIQKLEKIMDELVRSGQNFTSCVVTNERGLVVAEESVDGFSSQTLAAMISLMADTAIRVSENLGYGHPKTSSIKGLGVSISIREFMVQDRWFRIGAILSSDRSLRMRFLRKGLNHERAESKLADATRRLRSILED